jgi:hypothetical protein
LGELSAVLCVEVELKHVEDDDDVELVEEGEDDGAQQVQYRVSINNLKIA